MSTNFVEERSKPWFDSTLLNLPGVKAGKMFGYPAYKIEGQFFAFLSRGGIAVKLAPERTAELAATHDDITFFEPAPGRVWRNWALIKHDTPKAYLFDTPIFIEAMEYVLMTGAATTANTPA